MADREQDATRGRRSRRGSAGPSAEQSSAKAGSSKPPSEAATTEAPATKTSDAATTVAQGAKPSAKGPERDLPETRQEVHDWMVEIERKQARITKLGAAAAGLAVLASAAALYFAIAAPNSASETDVDDLSAKVDQLENQAGEAGGSQEQLKSQAKRLDAVEKELAGHTQVLEGIQAAFEALRARFPNAQLPGASGGSQP